MSLLASAPFASATALPATISENLTLTAGGNPYTGGAVKVEAGVVLKAEPGVEIAVTSLEVSGTLKAEGTLAEPVLFTSAGPLWGGIRLEAGSGASVLDHVDVRKVGNASNVAAIKVSGGSSPTITNSTVKGNSYWGIQVQEGGSPEIANNLVLENGRSGIYYSAEGKAGQIRIHDNLVEGNKETGIHVNSGTSVTNVSLSDNVIKGNGAEALTFNGGSSVAIPPDIADNVLSGNANNYIYLEGTVAQSATWPDNGHRIVSNGVTVASGATLTLGAGLRVESAPSSFTVKGTLLADGTAEDPIVFTSFYSIWGGIKLEAGSGASLLDHVEVSHGGNGTDVPAVKVSGTSSPTITNSTIRDNDDGGIQVQEGGSPEIANNLVLENGRNGIYYNDEGKSGQIRIHDNLVEGNKEAGIHVNSGTSVTNVLLSGNVIKSNGGDALSFNGGGSVTIPPDIADNVLIGNTNNYIYLEGTVAQSATWPDNGHRIVSNGVTVASGATLTLGAGLELENRPSTFVVKGTLKAEGTLAEPVLFTSAGPLWGGIRLEAGSGASVLDHVDVRKVGYASNVAAIKVSGGSSPTITNSTIKGNSYYGIHVLEGGAPEIANNLVLENGRSGIYYNDEGKSGQIRIHDNLVEGNKETGIHVNSGTSVTGVTLGGNIVLSNADAIDISGGEIPVDVDDNLILANGHDALRLAGSVVQSGTWSDKGFPFELDGALSIAGGASLSMQPGLLFKGKNSHEISVSGTLKAEGTANDPITFTSEADKASGEWRGLKFNPGSGSSVLDRVEIRSGGSLTGSAGIRIIGASPTITNSELRRNKGAVKVTESGSPKIERNRFRSNGSGLSYTGTGKLAAPNNDWGCTSGPEPAGCGDSVTSNVEWRPAAPTPEKDGSCRGDESQCGEGADPVSLATGQLTYSHRDLLLSNKSEVPLEMTRAYSSGSSADAGLGPGWSQTGLATATEFDSGEVLIVRQDGRQDLFVKTESGYKAPSGVTSTLTKVEGTFQLTTLERTVYRFDASGRIASITDDHGLKTTYGYDANGRLTTITDPSAQTLTFAYNSSNHITSVKDSTGREVKYGYSTAGDLATVTDALGGVTEYTYDSAHRLKTIKDPRGNVILKNTYDGQGRVIEQRDGLENLWTLEYKEGETIVTEPEGGKLTYGFDSQNRVVSERDQLGHTTTTSYDAAGNVDEIVKPGGAKWTFGHDSAGNLTSVVDPEEGERSYEYDGLNRLTSFTDERGETWSYEWDEGNDLVKVTDPAEGETTFTHDAAGLPLTVTDPNEHTTTFTYDARGNRLTTKDPLEHTTSYAYNARNQLTSKTAPGLKAETYERNALGDLLSLTTPEGHKTEYSYDGNGMLTQVKDPAANLWKVERNAMERPTAYVDPLEGRIEIDYDGNLNRVAVTDRRGKETTYAYDLANQPTEVVRPEGGDWELAYDALGNRVEVVEPRENATTYEFDLLNRMTAVEEPLETETTYGYDAAGNLTSFTDPRENTTEFTYDELGRLTEIAQPLEKTTTFTYDGVGNRLTRVTAEGTVSLQYDAANRLQEIAEGETVLRAFDYDLVGRMTGALDAQGDEIEIGYDDDGRLVSLDDDRGQTVSREYDSRGNLVKQVDGRGTLEYSYDSLNRMSSLTDPQSKVLEFGYDPEGNLTEVDLPNEVTTSTEYDDAGRVAAITSLGPEEALLESLEYEYDPFGNRTSQVDRLSQETTYAYDPLNRLTQFNPPGEGSTSYGYDPAGNRTEAAGVVYGFNALNQLTEASDGSSYIYDGAGRLTEITKGEESTHFDWTPLDELDGADLSGQKIDYTYDGFGRQATRDAGSGASSIHYGGMADVAILEADAKGEVQAGYLQGPSGLIAQRAGGTTSFPLRDARGDVTALAGEAGGVVSRQDYDPWGVQLAGPSLEMGFLGAQQRPSDPAVGLTQMGVRIYAPELGRFLSEDPVVNRVGLGATTNRYPYAGDNPLNRNDLNGRETCLPGPLDDACAPVTVHPPFPTPSDPIPEPPVTVDGVPSPAGEINDLIPDPSSPSTGEVVNSLREGLDFLSDRAYSFIQKHGGALTTGCITGGAAALLLYNTATGGAPLVVPGIGHISEGIAGVGGCVIGAVGLATTGVNPVRRN